MKSAIILLALVIFMFIVAGVAKLSTDQFPKDLYAEQLPKSVRTQPEGRQAINPLTSEKSDNPVQSGGLSIVQSLDETVMAVMNNKAMSNEKKFAFFWNEGYQKNKSSLSLSIYYIDCLASILPLPHVELLLTELGNPMTAAEIKNHLMQVLQSGYLRENGLSEDSKPLALHAIKSNIHNGDAAVAGEAVLLYARMGAPEDMVAILDDALQRKIISPLDYIREGAFQLPNVGAPKQQNALLVTLINTAQKSGLDESQHMLMTSLGLVVQSPSRLEHIDPATRNLIAQYLVAHEPGVRSDGINYDLVSAIYYSDWLYSVAIVKNKSEVEVLGWITRLVTDAAADPQKIVAVLISPMAPEIVRIASQAGQVDSIKHKVENAMAGLRPGTSAYTTFEAALEILG